MRFSVLLLSLFFLPFSTFGVTGEVILTNAKDFPLYTRIEQHLTDVINHLQTGDISSLNEYFTADGRQEAEKLISEVGMRNARAAQVTKLLKLSQGGFEVRDIKVQVDMAPSQGNPYQYLVFTLTPEGKIDNMRFGMEDKYYKDLVKEGDRLSDFAQRQEIIQFVELFRTAYNRRDLDFIQKVFGNDALIIVGHVVQERPDLPSQDDRLKQSNLSTKRIEFIQRSKEEYISSLRRVFNQNEFLKVRFDSLDVRRDSRDPDIYGVTLKQRWQSSTYTDTGYVFLMIDFKDMNNPLIHVRSWQPEPFEDGTVINLVDFEVIRIGDN